ncbi:MAG TPA: dTMP kinase [Acidimicrobiia bacterium]|nr:dTMP kinase [Acidimicrobiia bacterium]
MGAFVVLEGGDASGKSTQARLLADRLRSAGREVVETFEPGATEAGAAIRALLLDGDGPVDPTAEALLLAADRAQEVADVIRPALARGADVVSDRFVPSSLAYQGVGRGLGVERIEKLNRWATGGLEPDLVVVLDVDDAVAASRRAGPGDRLERAGDEFHAAVRDAYRGLSADRDWVVLDGDAEVDTVAERVWGAVRDRLDI